MDQPLASARRTSDHELFSLVEGVGWRGSPLDILVVLSRNGKFGVLSHLLLKSRHNNLKVDLSLPLCSFAAAGATAAVRCGCAVAEADDASCGTAASLTCDPIIGKSNSGLHYKSMVGIVRALRI